MYDDDVRTSPDPRPKKGYGGIIIGTIVALIAVSGGIWIGFAPTSGDKALSGPSLTPITSSPEAPSPTTTSSVTPEPPPLPQDHVAQGMPESFTVECGGETLIHEQGLTTTVRELKRIVGNTRYFNLAIQGDTVAIVKDDGVPWAALPGSDADTVSVWGHADQKPMAFNPIAQFRGDPSDCEATIEVPGGTLGYGYVQAHNVTPKDQQFDKSAELSSMPDKAGKLLVSTCDSAVSEVIWEFRLKWSKARQ